MDQLTVFFENPFWVGVFERQEQGMLQTARVVFGSEPKDFEVYDFVLREYASLKWSRPILVEDKVMRKRNPKRVQRDVQKAMKQKGISSKAQEAMRLERDANKLERRRLSKAERERQKRMRFEKRQEKKKEKRKGH